MTRILLTLATALLCSGTFAEDKKPLTFLDPAKAGEDYKIQGEYKGVMVFEGQKGAFGLQVIARGNHKFDAVAYVGGLPGDGWMPGYPMEVASGTTVDGVTKLYGGHGAAVIKGDKVTVYTDDEGEIGTLTKIERKSPTLGAKPPEGAIVLFDGSNTDHFEDGEVMMDNLLAANCTSKETLGSHTMHVEFRIPFKPETMGQDRGNSGVYLQSRYECQVLDSFGLEAKDNECGGIYSISKAAVNACFPPLTWQTYDIDFTAAEWKDGEKIKNARVTIQQNGIVIHDDRELPHGTPGRLPEEAGPAPLFLQGHGNKVAYRNIWVVKK